MVAHSNLDGHDRTSAPSSSTSPSPPSSLLPSDHLSLSAPLPAAPVPSHFPPFRCQKDFRIITDTASQLEHSGFYWGPLGVEEAHRMLRDVAPGSYLIRDSRRKDVFFTLSYRAESGPVSVRIVYRQQRFSLEGSERSFASLFALLEHYVASPKKSLSVPHRKRNPTLQELCRRRIVEQCGGGRRALELPLNRVLRDFVSEFPYKL